MSVVVCFENACISCIWYWLVHVKWSKVNNKWKKELKSIICLRNPEVASDMYLLLLRSGINLIWVNYRKIEFCTCFSCEMQWTSELYSKWFVSWE